jgi:hypothetical protein
MDDLWTIDTIDDGESGTFEESPGETRVEKMQPMPPPDLREHGLSASALHLDVHTGTRRWAVAGDDVPRTDEFDDDRVRAVDKFSAVASSRLNRSVEHSKNGMQQPTEMDVSRNDLYNGYNERLPRVARGLTDTRRGINPLHVEGHEVTSLTQRGPVRSTNVTGVGSLALGAGQHDSSVTHPQGSRSEVQRRQWRPLFRMMAHGVSAMRSVGVRYAGGNAESLPTNIVSQSKRGTTTSTHASNRHTQSERNVSATPGNVSTSKYDSTRSVRRGITDNTHERRKGLASDVALGNADSVSMLPSRRVTFDEIAASIYAQVSLGSRDATSNDAWNVKRRHDVSVGVVPKQETTMMGRGTISARMAPVNHESEYTRALESLRSRDSNADSVHVERRVADRVNEFQSMLVASHSRRQKETSSLAMGHNDRIQETNTHRAVGGDMKLTEDSTMFTAEQRDATGTVHARPMYTSNVSLSDQDAHVGRDGVVTSESTHIPVSGHASRPLRDDGGIYARHAPPATGAQRPGIGGASERGNESVLHITPPVRASMSDLLRAPNAEFVQRGTRA